ncbi:MAG: hypothetical protein V5A28_14650 [Haloarculaceae archaeon]
MRRREYLRSAVDAAGLAGLATSAPRVLGADDGSPSSSGRSAPGAATTEQEFAPMARHALGEGQVAEAVTTPDGRYAFVATLSGFRVVDLADPENPETVAGRDGILADRGPMENVKDVTYNRDRLLVAADRNGSFTGVALFDVRDPTEPRLLGGHRTPYGVHNCDLHGEYAYLTTGTELEILDVSDDPRPVARWSVADYDAGYEDVPAAFRNLHDVYVQGGRAYLAYWDAGAWILDVSDPTDPRYIGHGADHSLEDLLAVESGLEFFYEPPGNAHYVQPSDDGTFVAVGREAWDVEGDDEEDDTGGPAGITLWDTTDASAPERLATIDPPPVPEGRDATYGGYWTTAHNFDVVGDYLYSSWYQGGVKVHDVSDPGAPEELAHWHDGEVTQFWTAQAGVPGEYLVATNYADPSGGSEPTGLFVFPDPTDNPATVTPSGPPVDVSTPTLTPTAATPSSPTPAPTGTPTPSPSPTPSPTASPTLTASDESTATDGATATNGSGPGFGPLAALAALGVGAWRTVRRDGSDGER